MKSLRVVLLVFLSLLLPLRGAVAAAMLCPAASHAAVPAAGAAPRAGADTVDPAAADAGMRGGHCAVHHDGHAGAAHGDGHAGTCSACASICSMTPVPAPLPSLQAATAVSTLRFPALQVPVPSFHSDGQDRPPRRA